MLEVRPCFFQFVPRSPIVGAILLGLSWQAVATPVEGAPADGEFEVAASSRKAVTQHDVIPILLLRCTACHGRRRREGELDLRTRASLLKGGKSGPAIVPGKPGESLLLKRIHAGEMPPRRKLVEVSVKPMEANEVQLITQWIVEGAPKSPLGEDIATTEPDPLVSDQERRFWAFQRPEAAAPPQVSHADRVRNPIDAFVLRKLEERGLSFSPEADRRTLIRRAYYDLTGLPPDPGDVEAFLATSDANAYEALIDRFLASPRYGERWGRHWLDVAGYSDSEGVQHADQLRPAAYRYRDYVIESLNADKPYDRFLQEQFAGDELADYENVEVLTREMYHNLVATGFLRMSRDGTYANITNFVPDRLQQIADSIDVLGAVLGLTLKCAQCHSHKFDPIPQRDYYRLAAVLKGAYDEHDWLTPDERRLPHVMPQEREEWEAGRRQLEAEIEAQDTLLRKTAAEFRKKHLEARLAELPEVLRADLRLLLNTPKDKRNHVQKYLAGKFGEVLEIDTEELKEIDAAFKKKAEPIEGTIVSLKGRLQPEPAVRALWDRGEPSPTYVLQRGNYLTPGRLVGPGVPSVLTNDKTPFVVKAPWPGAKKTGRRLAFARWLTSPAHPLTARVMVNRVWRHHFGVGIVKTLDDFGKAGAPPTHTEVLDWLAVRFVRQGWSLKYLHRLIMTSSVYRQTSRVLPEHEKLDPDNRWLSRMPLRRLEAESLRDALLAVSGRLDLTPFGPADKVEQRDGGLVVSVAGEEGWRRSIYVLQRRTQTSTLLENFDLPSMSPNCVERTESIVAPQALHLLNNEMIHTLSLAFAERVLREVGTDVAEQIRRVYSLALQRPPSAEEEVEAKQLLAALTETWRLKPREEFATVEVRSKAASRALGNLCHAIMNSAEFLYID